MGAAAAPYLIGAQIVGAAYSAYSAYNAAQGQKQAAEYQAAVERNNAQVAEWQAQDAIRRGQSDKQQVQLKTSQLKGRQIAAMAERGLDLSEGSALNLLTDTDMGGAIDANRATDNAAREAYGYRVRGANSSANADLYQYKADSTNPWMSAGGSLLTSGSQVASTWYGFTEKGIYPFGIGAPKARAGNSFSWDGGGF